MTYSLHACFSVVADGLRRFLLTATWFKLTRWGPVAVLLAGFCTTSWGQCFQNQPGTNQHVTLPVGNGPFSVAAGDFNGDSRQDLAIATYNGTISVFLTNAQGDFNTASNFTVGAYPHSMVVGDFNGDGHSDLATANFEVNTVSVLLGNGNGGFGTVTNFDAGRSPETLTVVDFDGDGQQDLAVINYNYVASPFTFATDLSLLRGNGAGRFGPVTTFPLDTAQTIPVSVAAGDFNGDGRPDLAVANSSYSRSNSAPSNVIVLVNDGKGGFSPPTSFATGSYPTAVAVGDFNQDNWADLVVAKDSSNDVSLLLSKGNGTFEPVTRFAVGAVPSSVAVKDIDGDGKLDLAVTNSGSNNVSVLLGTGTGFNAAVNFPVGQNPEFVTVADFNNDSRPDLAVANSLDNNVSVLYNCTSGRSEPVLNGLSLVNADNGEEIGPLTDGQVVNLAALPTRNLSIRANASPATGSVTFALIGPQSHTKIESYLPFALFGDNSPSSYIGWIPPVGQYSLTATPFSEPLAAGQSGSALSVTFTVVDPAKSFIMGLSLVNADNGEEIGPLTDGQVVNLAALPTRNLSVRANASPATGSVTFALIGPQSHTKTESYLPFALFGDNSSSEYIGWTPPVGQYRLSLAPYTLPLAGGPSGQAISISFRIEDQAAARVAATAEGIEGESALSVRVLGNPTPAESVEVDIRGATGRSLEVEVSDEQGRLLNRQRIDKAEAIERRRVGLGRATGLYLLRVATPTESKTFRLLHHK